ncbi:hypothetical protein ABT224_19695 [Streptomyces sp. NPDC001584]|uniref:hypothetical protein n=1 Tax=Streptomyces sp. NPDC001584 TaxID=3154521 RepID=UPI003333821C
MDHSELPPVLPCPGQLPLFPAVEHGAHVAPAQPAGQLPAAEVPDQLQEEAGRVGAGQSYLM